MTAPPTTPPLFTTSRHMQFAYPSPTSTVASHTSFPRASMSPRQEPNEPSRRKSSRASAGKSSGSNGNLSWVVGGSLEELKSKKNMHTVRQTAMASYLKNEKSRDNDKPRANSDVSENSPSSIGSQGGPPNRRVANPRPKPNKRGGNNSSLFTESSASVAQAVTSPDPESQVARVTGSFQHTLTRRPIVVPIIQGVQYPFDIHPVPPLVSIGTNLDPFRTMFQSSYPHVSVEKLKYHCSHYFGTRGLGRHWIPACLDHPHTFLSTLYMASAHYDVLQGREVESLETAALRQDVIHLVGANLTDPQESVADHNIIAVSQLILGSVIGWNEAGLGFHQAGIEKMITQRGGLGNLGLAGFLASAISWAHLATSVLQETRPTSMYTEYCAQNARKDYQPNDTIPESPLYSPRGKYNTLETSTSCTPNALQLLTDMRSMYEDFLAETHQKRRNSTKLMNLYTRITSYPSIQQLRRDNVLREGDWRYEAIRITALVQAYAIINRIPLSEALKHLQSPRKPSTLYSSSAASHSNDSLVSSSRPQHDTPSTEYSGSPSLSLYGTSPADQHSYFTAHRPSTSSTHSFSSAQRPSITSWHSASPDLPFWSRSSLSTTNGTSPLRDVREALEHSNLSECWSDMAGVLLWIALVMGAASSPSDCNKVLRRYFTATTMRACIMLCFEHPEAMHATMLTMTDVLQALGCEGHLLVSRHLTEDSRKRTKM